MVSYLLIKSDKLMIENKTITLSKDKDKEKNVEDMEKIEGLSRKERREIKQCCRGLAEEQRFVCT